MLPIIPQISHIHSPLRGVTRVLCDNGTYVVFQSTPPCGGDHDSRLRHCLRLISIHAPMRGRLSDKAVRFHLTSPSFFREGQFSDFLSPVIRCFFFLFASPSRLQHHGGFRVVSPFGSQVLDFVLIGISQVVEPQAVVVFVDEGFQFSFQKDELGLIQQAFEHGILHPLSVSHAAFGYFPQPGSPGRGFGVYIIGYQDQHGFTSPKMPDTHPDLLSAIWPGAGPGRRGKVPRVSFLSKRDVPVFPVSVPATG